MDKEMVVDLSLLQEILDYLQTRPYAEVHVIIGKLLNQVNDNKE